MNPLGLIAGLATVLAALVWSQLGQHMPARGAGMLLALVGLVAVFKRPPILGDPARWWTSPLPWLWAAVAWQVLAWSWSPVPDPASFRVVERAGALAAALGFAALLAGRDVPGILGTTGAVILIANVLGQLPVGGQSLGVALGLGEDPPFGNTNFNSGGALALLAVGLARPRRDLWPILTLGTVAALVLGLGLINGDGNRAALVGLLVVAGMTVVLRLPRRLHGPVLLGVGLLGIGIVVTMALCWWYPQSLGPSTGFRLACWRAAIAGWWESPLWGHGPAASLTVINRQEDYQMAWLSVPGYTEHAHSEPLEMLIDGGLILAGLLAVGLVLLLKPLWERREDHPGLVTGWAVAVVMGCLESHYGQPGPLLGLGLLAGGTLGSLGTMPSSRANRTMISGMASLALLTSLLLELRWDETKDAGHCSPPVREVLARRWIEATRAQGDWSAVAEAAARLQHDLGPLDDLCFLRAEAAAHRRLNDEALRWTLAQGRQCPLLPGHIALAGRLREVVQRQGHAKTAQALSADLNISRTLVSRWEKLKWSSKDPHLVAWLSQWARSESP